jgi:hypothetical protein
MLFEVKIYHIEPASAVNNDNNNLDLITFYAAFISMMLSALCFAILCWRFGQEIKDSMRLRCPNVPMSIKNPAKYLNACPQIHEELLKVYNSCRDVVKSLKNSPSSYRDRMQRLDEDLLRAELEINKLFEETETDLSMSAATEDLDFMRTPEDFREQLESLADRIISKRCATVHTPSTDDSGDYELILEDVVEDAPTEVTGA